MKLAILLVSMGSAWAGSGCILVDHSSVTAGDLAAAMPEFGAIASDRHMLWAPAPGLTRWLKSVELQKIAAREGMVVSPSAAVCIQRRTVVFSEAAVVSALRERLPAGAKLRLVDYCRLPVMSGRLKFEARPLARPPGKDTQLLWKGAVIGDDRRSVPFWATVQVQIERRVVRAIRPISVNSVLSNEDLTEDTVQSPIVETAPSPRLSDLIGKETSRSISPQQEVQLCWLRTPQMIRKGQTVRVAVESGQAKLNLDARALNGGKQGDTVLIKNDESGRTFRAEITGPGQAAIRMEASRK